MNSLKTLFVSAVLVAVLYGIYSVMNRTSESSPPLQEAASWNGEINIEPGVPLRVASVAADQQARLQNNTTNTTAPPIVTQPGGEATNQAPAPKMAMSLDVPGDAANSVQPATPAANAIVPLEIVPKRPDIQESPPSTAGSRADDATGPSAPQGFDAFMSVVRGELDRGRLLDAYRMLSDRYHDPQFTPEENHRIEYLLDRLAGTVVYSKHHIIEQPYRVGANETLEQIARRYNVPPELLARINGIVPSGQPTPGSELKVVRGPFLAEIDLDKHELTLRLPDGGYAGRFSIGVGCDVQELNKEYRVYDKIAAPPDSAVTQAGYAPDPAAKQKWIGLEGRLGIHAATNPADVGRSGVQGGITLRESDVDDLFDILSVGSRVVIRR